jgi:hypothetical protein
VSSRLPALPLGRPRAHASDADSGKVDHDEKGEGPAEEADVGREAEHETDGSEERKCDHERPRWGQHVDHLSVDDVPTDRPSVGASARDVVCRADDLRVCQTADLWDVRIRRAVDVARLLPG